MTGRLKALREIEGQITPSRLMAAFTRTSGLATHITPKFDHFGSGQLSFVVRPTVELR